MSLSKVTRDRLVELRDAGATYAEIAQITGLSKSAIANRLKANIAKPRRHAAQQQRACLCCGKAFLSEGAHNRLCDACRRLSGNPFDVPHAVHYR